MYRKFIATVTAASIALTTLGALPAVAGDRQTVNAVAALLGLAVVGKIIHDRNDKKKQASHHQHKPVHREPAYKKPVHKKPVQRQPAYQPPRYDQPKPRPLPDRVSRKNLPQQCLRQVKTHRGHVRMFASRCLQRNYRFAHRLPSQCNYTFNTGRGERRGYEARCLRQHGYRLARG
ncbi:hypothetical protein [Sulfitobacter geojensis]|uniref:Lectin-like protein BA14k n=1 Tax=Sulfitobacter geojensis TaxID=1342299 RepID=A0AAE2VZ13_9RHOB|nr:hypothetical protein [Sulfitobacter geojensis]MBM1693779.1 hypothetical protein [Sulfitobacter geojensis]MBM1705945.1 hypothetical protein [Sulfitobacter geojensis]MBM1710003.1 hypothetical protein [Sulfitobacter geojensis]MBM1714069.1 hypothetical protein [Sulfitobacter geojensis]MBM1718136.1 hypothetical protein [Sulfitobacter geojensis]